MRDRTIVFTFGIMLAFSVILLLQGCRTQNKLGVLTYFNEKGDTALSKIIQNSEPAIQAGDLLSVTVNALDPASAAPYNLGSAVSLSTSADAFQNTTGSNPGNKGYLVEADGTIHFPQLGKIAVVGMQRKQLIDLLTEKLSKFVNDPIVTIRFLNFKVTVLGEVTKPGTINIPDGKVNLAEAIGLAGDLPLTARRDNIMVIREKNGQREFGSVNILSRNAFSSPYYILKQNDIVYVEVTKEKAMAADVSSSKLRSNIALVTTALSIISTVVVLIINFKK